MLERGNAQGAAMPSQSDTMQFDIEHLIGILLRQARIIVLCLMIGLGLGIFILMLTPRSYQSASQIIIERQLDSLAPDLRATPSQADVESQILNQVEVIGSSRLAEIVAEAEGLTTDVEFLNPPPSMMGRLRDMIEWGIGMVTGAPALEREVVTGAPIEAVTAVLRRNVKVTRVGRSSVIWLGYETHSPELAYRIARAYATAFVQDQLNADLEVTSEAAEWLRERLLELGDAQREAALEVEAFRQEAGLTISTDTELTEQRLENLTSQIVLAQGEVARYGALVSQLEQIDLESTESVVAGLGILPIERGSETTQIAQVLEAYLSAERRIVDVTSLYGAEHPQVALLRREQQMISGQMRTRLEALLNQYRNALSLAGLRVEQLRSQVNAEGQAAVATNQALIQLTALQQRSNALNVLYGSYLTRYEETIQQQSFPIPAARVISQASLSNAATGPRTTMTLAGALILGAFLGLGFATLNELRERSFRVGNQVTREVGQRFLGYLPVIPSRAGVDKLSRSRQVLSEMLRQITGRRAAAPTTPFAETLKAVKIAVMSKRFGAEGMVAGVVSVLPGEGKTSVSIGLAALAANAGNSVLLIDADLRGATATTLLAAQDSAGVIDIANGLPWREAVLRHEAGFDVIPARSANQANGGNDDLAAPFMQRLLDEARHDYDLVILDLPPLGALVDAVSIHHWTDGFVLVAEWGRTPRRLVRGVIDREPQIAEDMFGVVLNRVQLEKLPHYSNFGDTERFMGAYPNYFQMPPKRNN